MDVSRGWIPRSAHNAKLVLFKNLEDTFYKFLRRDREFNNPQWPFLIKVRDVQGKEMIDATFNKRAKNKDNSDTYSMTIQAKRAAAAFRLRRPKWFASTSTRPKSRTTARATMTTSL